MWNKATDWVAFGDRRPQRRQAHRYRVSVFLQLARGMTSLTRVPMATPRASPRRVGVARLIRPFLDEPGGGALDNYNEQLGGGQPRSYCHGSDPLAPNPDRQMFHGEHRSRPALSPAQTATTGFRNEGLSTG